MQKPPDSPASHRRVLPQAKAHPPKRVQQMTQLLTIRPAGPSDYDQWRPLWDGYNAFYRRSGATALPEGITQMTWARFFDAYEPVRALVAERAERLGGLTHYLLHRSTTAAGPVCYLQD